MAGKRVYIPQPVSVQMPATKENPGGRVVQLAAGWTDLDEDMQSHPILARLIPQSEGAQSRSQQLYEAEQKRNEAVAKADQELAEARLECQTGEQEERLKMSEEWTDRREEAARNGTSFNEVHPDPETQRAIALTSNHGFQVPTAGMAQKVASDGDPMDKLPSEKDSLKRQRERVKLDKDNEGKAASGAASVPSSSS